jgi:hypothetical protein
VEAITIEDKLESIELKLINHFLITNLNQLEAQDKVSMTDYMAVGNQQTPRINLQIDNNSIE